MELERAENGETEQGRADAARATARARRVMCGRGAAADVASASPGVLRDPRGRDLADV
jgi:hypothetical protein